MEFQHLLWAPLVVTAPVDLLSRISSVEGGSTLSSLEMVIPFMLMSLRMILNTLDTSTLPQRPTVRPEPARTAREEDNGREKALIADVLTPGYGV